MKLVEDDNGRTLETPLTLTLGKGGVGKTTISAGLCVAERRRKPSQRVSICSIDPAPSLDDVFATKVDDEPRAVLGDAKLRATEFDAVAAFRSWAERIKDRLERGLSQERGGLHIDLSFDRRILVALLDMTPPGVDEIFAVFRIRELSQGDVEGRDRHGTNGTCAGGAGHAKRECWRGRGFC